MGRRALVPCAAPSGLLVRGRPYTPGADVRSTT
jgi:hypothetical protein